MTKKEKFTITTFWILFSRSYDAYCTFQLTPDLSKESNPLVTVLGMTWTPLLLTVSILTIYALYAYYLATFKPKDLLPKEKGFTFSNIIAYTYLGQKGEWTSVFYKVPKELSRFNQYMGQNLTKYLVFAGFVSTTMWLLINNTDFYTNIHSVTLIYSILIIGCGIITYKWSKQQYKLYLTGQE